MAKLFTAEAARRNFNEEEKFNKAIDILSQRIKEASESKRFIRIPITDKDLKDTMFLNEELFVRVCKALISVGYEVQWISCHGESHGIYEISW